MNKIINLILTFLKALVHAIVHTKEKFHRAHNKKREASSREHPRRKRKTSITETTTKTTEILNESFGSDSSSPGPDKKE